jgi:Tol biopolymer transport system component
MKVTRLTSNGRVKSASISPDGKYAAYILADALAGDSIYLVEVGTSSDARVFAPEQSSLGAIRFAPDGNSLYFYREKEKEESGYYRIPMLGGALESILPGVQSSIALSPGGKRVAFLETDPRTRETTLMIANAEDGGDQRQLAALASPRAFTSDGLAWSPDGKVIAIGVTGPEQQFTRLVTVQLADGTITPTSNKEWGSIRDLEWLSDGSGLVMVAGDDEMLDASQVWLVHYPDGEARRITNDILRYGSDISVSFTSNELVVVATRLTTNIWVSPIADPSQARQVTFGAEGRFDGLYGLHWTPDGRIVYGAYVGYDQTIWIMNEDGSGQRQLTPAQRRISDSAVRVSADGSYIVFHSNRSGSNEIWRIDVNGDNPTQITGGGTNYQPAVSPDRKWVVYRSWGDGKGLLWKVPIDGSEPVRLTDKAAAWPGVSPDGRFIACSSEGKLVVIPFEGGTPVKTFDMPATATLFPSGAIWSPDTSALLYHDTTDGIWRQALAGGKPEKIPGLRPEAVLNFALSGDGQKLAITYGTQSSDAVLIREFR